MKRHTLLYCCVTLTLLLALTSYSQAQTGANGGTRAAEKTQVEAKVTGGIVTLYALDPLGRTFCFADGKDGMVFQHNEVRNRCSDIDFNTYRAGGLSVGIEGGRIGSIVELGNALDLKQRYGYDETVGSAQGFASLRAEDGKVLILKERKTQTVQEVREAAPLFEDGTSLASAPIKAGSIYLMRLTDRHDKAFQRLVKLLVVAYTPNESVTIRWQLL